MAFTQKKGKKTEVRHGTTGEVLSTYSSEEKAKEEVKRLHKKNKPKPKNRNENAKNRDRTREKKKDKKNK